MAKADVAPGQHSVAPSGRLTHTSQTQPDVNDNIEEPGQEESGQQEAGDSTNDALMASGQSKGKATKNGLNNINIWNHNDFYIAVPVLVLIAQFFYSSLKNSGGPINKKLVTALMML